MLAGTYNIICEQGATFLREITVTNADGSLPNYNGSSARMQVKVAADSASSIIDLTTTNARLVLLDNTITMNITAADTEELAPAQYKYDLEIATGSEVTRLIQGNFVVSPEVTKILG